jgi:hypothetical protein
MKTKGLQIFLAVVISLAIPMFSAYVFYSNFAQTDFYSADLIFEYPDQERQLVECQNELIIFGLGHFSDQSVSLINSVGQSISFSPWAGTLSQNTSILRC